MSLPVPVVGIGASDGGIKALEAFFRGLPDRAGIAIIVVTQLNPERSGVLHEIVARSTDLPVTMAADGAAVQAGCVYVLPADAVLGITDGRLRIAKPAKGRHERNPLDVFFSALAMDQGELAAAIVLSGGDSDGTLGIKAIKERGGLTLAQVRDGYGPHRPDVLESAIATGLVDFVVPAAEMGTKLAEFAHSMRLMDEIVAASGEQASRPVEEALPEIYSLLRNQVGHDFSGYKTRTFVRRVQRRMHVTQTATPEDYTELLRQDAREVAALFRDLLINVTTFFRDADAFEALEQEVLPKLFAGRGSTDTIRVWVPGCSTGEEVFSLAMLFREYAETLDAAPRVQIFATDIDERSLLVARAARYPTALLESVSAARRARFFVAEGGSYVLCKEVRELCIFSSHSVLRDPPFSRMDLISCRNLLIYFGVKAQNQAIPTFYYALRPGGYLFLGTSESVSQFDDLFAPLEKKHRIFQRRAGPGQSLRVPYSAPALGGGPVPDRAPRAFPFGPTALRQLVDGRVLERFAPSHVAVNREGDVVYYSGRTGKYLEAAAGPPTRQIMVIARRELRLDLRALLREVVETGRPARRENVSLETEDGRVQFVSLLAEPLDQAKDGSDPLVLIVFMDQGPMLSREEALSRIPLVQARTVQQTERELRDTRERLQSMIEEYETAFEELKSSNEELVSVNEELQSTNEELEASKEELLSLNEELNTSNFVLSSKVAQLDQANTDLQNLFENAEVATVFLDSAMQIRSYTPPLARIFAVLPSDRGRPLTDVSSRFQLGGLEADIRRVLTEHTPLERTLRTTEDSADYLARLAPYLDTDQRADGVVISFIDVTSLAAAEARQRVLVAELQHRTRNLLGIVQSITRQTLDAAGSLGALPAKAGSVRAGTGGTQRRSR